MAEVEHRPFLSFFALVARDHARFDPAAFEDDVLERVLVSLENRAGILLEEREQGGAGDDAVLDDFGQPAAKLAIGQRLERRGVDPDAPGLVESADQVLGAGMIDARLCRRPSCRPGPGASSAP